MKRLAVVVLFAFAAPLFAAIPAADPCEGVLPHALNFGLPRIASGEAKAVEPALRSIFSAVYAQRKAADPCADRKGMEINIAVGNDYQMLDWLGQGTLDAAIVTDLSLALLARDDVRLYQVNAFVEDLLPPAHLAPMARVRDQERGRWNERTDAEREYNAFLREVWAAALTDDAKREDERRKGIRHVLLLASHLSSPGFAAPVAEAITHFNTAATALANRDPRANVAAIEKDAWRFFFQSTRFAIDCASADDCFNVALAGDRTKAKGEAHRLPHGTTAVLFPGEEMQRNAPIGDGKAFREHLVITAAAAQRIFGVKAADEIFGDPRPHIPGVLGLAITRNAPSELRSTFQAEPLVGTRTHAFMVDEVMQLLRQQKRSTSDGEIALVLPGGGVKAAYQTRIMDELYKHHYLTNAAVADPNDLSTLAVRNVIGTSGGALLGYFVSQLREEPLELFDILWQVNGHLLTSSDVFGWTDLLRYVSVVFSFCIFCAVFLISSMKQLTEPGTGRFRLRLLIGIMPLFILAPVLIRHASGDNVEAVPEIEGIFYAIMALVVMIADQWIIRRETPKETTPERDTRLRLINNVFAVVGVLLISVPLLGDIALETYMPFIAAFGTMTILLISTALAVAKWFAKLHNPPRRLIEIGVAIGIVLLYCAFGVMPHLPHLVTGIFLFFLVGLQIWYTGAKPRGIQWLITLAAVFLVAMLCWPEAGGARRWSFLTAESLHVTTAAFFLSLGFILLIASGALWSYRGATYDVEGLKDVGMAMTILLGYALATLVTMMLLTRFFPEFVTPLELTGRFWLVLAGVSLVLSVIILRVSRRPRFAELAWARTIQFLRRSHPNGLVMHRRYVRILALAIFSVTWWNVVAAPALYGNRVARGYHGDAIREFAAKSGDFAPTARFVAPANLLRQNGTRYFVFLADDEQECPPITLRPASGAVWRMYPGATITDKARCSGITPDRGTLAQNVSFASGSPFPIFPAHHFDKSPDDAPYIDGGYSNNVPVDAARTLQSRQVLIVESSNPLPKPASEETWKDVARHKTLGYLVVNLGRLPAYLFEHAQQVDRLSRADLFVVTLAPSRDEPNWPALFDFRGSVVRQMRDTADRDLHNRIGIVESWGQPAFSLHVKLAPAATPSSH